MKEFNNNEFEDENMESQNDIDINSIDGEDNIINNDYLQSDNNGADNVSSENAEENLIDSEIMDEQTDINAFDIEENEMRNNDVSHEDESNEYKEDINVDDESIDNLDNLNSYNIDDSEIISIADKAEDESESDSNFEIFDDREALDNGKGKKSKKNGKSKIKKPKKDLTPAQKKKKRIIIACVAAATVLVITLSILIPILVVNAPKQFIGAAEDFSKEVGKGKDYYVMQENIDTTIDIKLVMSVDMNDKNIKTTGTITINNTKKAELVIGTKDGNDYIGGGIITAKKVIFTDIPSANILSSIVAEEIEVTNVVKSNFAGEVKAASRVQLTNSNATFNGILFASETAAMALDKSIVAIKGDALAAVSSTNSTLDITGNTMNVNLDSTSIFKTTGTVYANNTKTIKGNVIGGKQVVMRKNSSAKIVSGAAELWVDESTSNLIESYNAIGGNIKHLLWLNTPITARATFINSKVLVYVPAVDNAEKVEFFINGSETPIVMDINSENTYDLTEQLFKVGSHEIKIIMRTGIEEQREFIVDSDPITINYTQSITLAMVSNAKVSLVGGEYILTFNAVENAKGYRVILDGVAVNITGEVQSGALVTYNLSDSPELKELLTLGDHVLKIVSTGDVNIKESDEAIAEFPTISAKVGSAVITSTTLGKNITISWGEVQNANRYSVYVMRAGVPVLLSSIAGTSHTIEIGKDVLVGESIYVVAEGAGNYTNSDKSNEIIIAA